MTVETSNETKSIERRPVCFSVSAVQRYSFIFEAKKLFVTLFYKLDAFGTKVTNLRQICYYYCN